MASVFTWGLRLGRAVGGVLLVGCLLTGPSSVAAAKDPPKEEAAKPAEPKKASAPAPNPGIGPAAAEQVRYINELIEAGWKANKVSPSVRCSDYEFIRRASLDIIGRIPNARELEQFFRDPSATRRSLLVDRLLKSDDYVKNWANVCTVWLLSRSGSVDPARQKRHEMMRLWLEDKFARERNYKEVATELVTATGKESDNGATGFILSWLGEPIPNKQAEEGQFDMVPITARTTRLFLGLQTQCVQCHDHPFGPSKQKDFWGVNAFFRQVKVPGYAPMRRGMMTTLTLEDDKDFNQSGRVFYERRNGVVMATKGVFLDGTKLSTEGTTTRREELAKLITTSDYFPKAYVNRMWAHFMGRGFTVPVDDFSIPDNTPSHPELLDKLAKDFAGSGGYEPRNLIRWICNSNAYNLSSVANNSNKGQEAEPFFARMQLKAMSPEQLFESLMVATRSDVGLSREAKKKLREEWTRSLVVNFGDDEGNEATFNGTVVQALMLMNGKQINDAITKTDGTVVQAMKRHSASSGVINELFMAALNRPANGREAVAIGAELKRIRAGGAYGLYQDVFWALLNSNEFLLNH
jgi:hypothetical protein